MPSGPWIQKPLHATLSDVHTEISSVPPSPEGSQGSYHSTNDGITNISNSNGKPTPSVTSSIRSMERHLNLFDLASIGIGGTVGSGIFVLCGFIANRYAGPATCICWIISGFAACLSGVCYAEMACRMPAAGSSYAYVYASMGELPAVLAAACLTLEYVISGSAVARSWGDKMTEYIVQDLDFKMDDNDGANTHNIFGQIIQHLIEPNNMNFNFFAMIVSTASIILLMNGVKESKSVTNFFTVVKVMLVVFMSVAGLIMMKPRENLIPFIPQQFGWAGILRGATSSFFGYIGFDELTCMAHEAIDPQRNMPLAIVLVLGGVMALYVTAAIALTGMQPYQDISGVSGFPVAFRSNNQEWAAQITAFGEVFTLPIVVLISLLAQPRLQYALAKDGLLPPIFAKVDQYGNLWHGTVLAGILMVVVASFVPFDHLNDMISAGILVAFTMTDSSLILMRFDSPEEGKGKGNSKGGCTQVGLVERCVCWLSVSSFAFSLAATHFFNSLWGKIIAVICMLKVLQSILGLALQCKPATVFGGKKRKLASISIDERMDLSSSSTYFKTPMMPFIPCLGIFVNWYLIAQLELLGIGLLLAYLGAVTLFYFCYSRRHSVGNNGGWEDYENDDFIIGDENVCNESALLTHVSLPPLA